MMFLCRWTLTEDESYTTFEAWRTNLMTILAYEEAFTPFLKPDATWGRKTKTSPLRGFHVSDAAQQVTTLVKRTRLLLLARVTALPFIGYVIHKHSPSTRNKVCAVPRTAYITSFLLWNLQDMCLRLHI